MLRLRTPRNFGIRNGQESLRKLKSVIVIACEGKTEETYFKLFNNQNKIIKVRDVSIEVLEKMDENDRKSAPKHVMNLLQEYQENYQIESDELWMVIDRDSQNNKKSQLKEIIKECSKMGFNLAMSNPTFELWLLLHVKNMNEYDDVIIQKIKENRKVNKNKRFLEKELSLLLGGYTKGVIREELFLPRIKFAIEQARSIEISYQDRKIDDFGTTVYLLVEKIIEE